MIQSTRTGDPVVFALPVRPHLPTIADIIGVCRQHHGTTQVVLCGPGWYAPVAATVDAEDPGLYRDVADLLHGV